MSAHFWWTVGVLLLLNLLRPTLGVTDHYLSNIDQDESSLELEDLSAGFDGFNQFTSTLIGRDEEGNNASGQTGGGVSISASGDFTCGPHKKCSNGACCGKSGWCGYTPKYCGKGCQSNCDAKAECGKYADPKNKTCPLNVCCSNYGFCGTTSEFCGSGCQSNCHQPKPNILEPSNVQKRIVGYWESWNTDNDCGTMSASEIPIEMLTHLNIAFGYVNWDWEVVAMDGISESIYRSVASLKDRSPSLKVIIALGGWAFTDKGKWQGVFTHLVGNKDNRAKFIKNLMGTLAEYGIDGVDFDWEYPGASDRGGRKEDGENFTLLLKELRQAIDDSPYNYIVTFTAPTSYWYLRHFDLHNMVKYVDWVNLMSYDLHGVWDAKNPIGNQVLGHTNLTEINEALDLFWRVNVSPAKIVLGMAFYGRSFELSDPSCWQPGCSFKGPGQQGPCTKTAGILSFREIMDVVKETKATPVLDRTAAVNYLVYKGNNWISYDNNETFHMKIRHANNLGLSGIMIWALDLDNTAHQALNSISPLDKQLIDPLTFREDENEAIAASSTDSSACFVQKNCGDLCPPGYTAMTRVGRLDGQDTCPTDNFRYVCCPSSSAPPASACHWASNRTSGVPTDCAGQCNIGQLKIAGDSWGWVGDLKTGHADSQCLRGGTVFCCDAGNKQQYLDICSWTTCGGSCKKEFPHKPHVLTRDNGGANHRCGWSQREYCCPSKNSFTNCDWHWGGACSESCDNNQIQLDEDPVGDKLSIGTPCYDSRLEVFCCDPPGGTSNPFLPVDLDRVFPSQYLPAASAVPKYDLVSFGNGVEESEGKPNDYGVAFFLIAGDSYAVSHLKKRDDEPEPFTFITCPETLESQSDNAIQTARVVCLGSDVEGCFRVNERGVEGTIVEMPDNCGRGTWARAVSLTISSDQSLPEHLKGSNASSAVYDFSFDYNMKLFRRDAGPTSVRMDYSNVPGYWDTVVRAKGIQSRDLKDRFFSDESIDWNERFNQLSFEAGNGKKVHEVVSNNLLWNKIDHCQIGSKSYPEAVGAGLGGVADAEFYYGFSLIGTIEAEEFTVKQSAGFLRASGTVSSRFFMAGAGKVDMATSHKGNPAHYIGSKKSLGGHNIFRGWATFDPYYSIDYEMGTQGEGDSSISNFDGDVSAEVVSHFGRFSVYFPGAKLPGSGNGQRQDSQIRIAADNKLYGSVLDSKVALGTTVNLGLKVDLDLPSAIGTGDGDLPDMSINCRNLVEFDITVGEHEGTSCLDYKLGSEISQTLDKGPSAGWANGKVQLAEDMRRPDNGKCFQDAQSSTKRDLIARGSGSGGVPGFAWTPGANLAPNNVFGHPVDAIIMTAFAVKLLANPSCVTVAKEEEEGFCCDCVCMDWKWGFSDLPACDYCDLPDPDSSWKDGILHSSSKRAIDMDEDEDDDDLHALEPRRSGVATMSYKDVSVCGIKLNAGRGYTYPAFPDNPTYPWDGIQGGKWDTITKYWGNSSDDCANWDILEKQPADEVYPYPGANKVRARYQTEHVFEGQIIGDFFSRWLALGKINNQPSSIGTAPSQRLSCTGWTDRYIKGIPSGSNFHLGGQKVPFIKKMLSELGSQEYLDRLAIFMTRPNQKKGRLFTGVTVVKPSKYSAMSSQDQLQSIKELGLIFNYMNDATVWAAFCETYEAIYSDLEEFDDWYQSAPGVPNAPSLQDEWKKYIRTTLKAVTIRGQIAANTMFFLRKRDLSSNEGQQYEAKWQINKNQNQQQIRLTGSCLNL